MADYTAIKNLISDVVKTNGAQEITGANLQNVLVSMINAVASSNNDDFDRINGNILNLLNYVDTENEDIRDEMQELANRLDTNRYGYNVTVFGLVAGVHTLATAVKNVPPAERFGGQKITFKTDAGWVTYQNTSLSIDNYEDVNNWVLDSGVNVEGNVTITNNPDYEDLTQNSQNELKFADKEYSAATFSGLGRIYLRKNIVSNKNVLTQEMLSDANTIYIIQYDYDLDGENITTPANCVLKFEGGSLSNGILELGSNTLVSNGVCNDVQFFVNNPNITFYDTKIENTSIGAPIVGWTPKSNLTIKKCELYNSSPRVTGVNLSSRCDCVFLSLKEDVQNIIIEGCKISARCMCVEIYTYNQDVLAVANDVVIRNNKLTQLDIDDVSVSANACWPISFSGNPQNSVIEGNIINGGYYGIEVVSCQGVRINSNYIYNTVYAGIFITGTSNNCTIVNNYIKDTNYCLRIMNNTSNINISDNFFDGTIFKSNIANYNAISLQGEYIQFSCNFINNCYVLGNCSEIIVANNFINASTNTYASITFDGGSGIVVKENHINAPNNTICVRFNNGVASYVFNRNNMNNNGGGSSTSPAILSIKTDDYNIENGKYIISTNPQDFVIQTGEYGRQVIDPSKKVMLTAIYNNLFNPDGSVYGTNTYGSSTDDRPNANKIVNLYGFRFFDRAANKPIFAKNIYTSSGRVDWVEGDGANAGVARSGATSSRPTGGSIYVGFVYLDTTIGKPIYAKEISGNTVTWVDATGATV